MACQKSGNHQETNPRNPIVTLAYKYMLPCVQLSSCSGTVLHEHLCCRSALWHKHMEGNHGQGLALAAAVAAAVAAAAHAASAAACCMFSVVGCLFAASCTLAGISCMLSVVYCALAGAPCLLFVGCCLLSSVSCLVSGVCCCGCW